MNKRLFKCLSIFLSFLLILSAVSLPSINTMAKGIKDETGFAKRTYSTNGHTQAEAVAYANSLCGKSIDYDGVYGAQCVDLILQYCAWLGVNIGAGNANAYASKNLPAGWTYTYSPQAGDIAVWTSGQYGHVAIVTEIRSSTFVIVEQNYSNQKYVTPREIRTASSGVAKYIHPDFVTNRDPVGFLDYASGGVESIRVSGWAIDYDDPNYQVWIHVYVGGPAGSGANCYVIKADKYRSDGNIGYHGFDDTISVSEIGTVDVYAYAINNITNTNNPLLGSKTVTIEKAIVRPTLSKTKITEITNSSQRTMTVRYKAVKNREGYSIEYATNSKFRNATRTNTAATYKKIGKLTKGNIYYVRVRAWARDSAGKLVYSPWSATQKVKIKK